MELRPHKIQSLSDPARLEVLKESGLLDSLPEESFDRFTRLAVALLRSEVSLVSIVDDHRQFFKSQVGLTAPYDTRRETPLTHSFCQLVVRDGTPLVVEDARTDERVRDNLAIRDLGVISYLGMPITSQEGFRLGSLCAINSSPRVWSPEDRRLLADLARAVSAEVHLRQSEQALKESVSLLQENEQQREKSLHMLVHDLRTPAGAIVSLTGLLESTPPDLTGEQRELVRDCQESATSLLSMIQDLLEINRLRAGSPADGRDGVKVSSALRHAAQMVAPILREASIRLAVDYPDAGGEVPGDARQIERVLLNLLTNAAKFSPAGSGISLSAHPVPEGFRFEVRDGGPGVPDSEKEAIFQQHFIGSVAGERGMPSFGIGLAFCKMAVEAHGGRIGVADAPGGGSIFYFVLPAAPNAPA
jgi:signal transduction histidine kinase